MSPTDKQVYISYDVYIRFCFADLS